MQQAEEDHRTEEVGYGAEVICWLVSGKEDPCGETWRQVAVQAVEFRLGKRYRMWDPGLFGGLMEVCEGTDRLELKKDAFNTSGY